MNTEQTLPTISYPVSGRSQRRTRVLRIVKRVLVGLSVVALVVLVVATVEEIRCSRWQAHYLASLARETGFWVQPGQVSSPVRAPDGPYDRRLGYSLLPSMMVQLDAAGYQVAAQARPSWRMEWLAFHGLFPVYREKTRTGLSIEDRTGRLIYHQDYPIRTFRSFQDIPPVVVNMLLFIENRHLLLPGRPTLNPAVDWKRFGRALVEKAFSVVQPGRPIPGGSTLATQMEKFRHSPEGITGDPGEKLRQMASASVRAYLDGENTFPARQRIVLDYINSVPLAARTQYGEINGLGDGLWAWFGQDFEKARSILLDPSAPPAQRAVAVKQVLSLFIAHKRPTYFLQKDPAALEARCARFLPLLAQKGIISYEISRLALRTPLNFRRGYLPPPPMSLEQRKAVNAIRSRLLSTLGVSQLYDLDRMDLKVRSTLDLSVQNAVTRELQALREPTRVQEAGLTGYRLLESGDPSKVIYSLTLYERTPRGNLLRVQTDNLDQPLNINEGIKLELGSTAKLRTMVTYLEIMAELHHKYSAMPQAERAQVDRPPQDVLARWMLAFLDANPGASLEETLRASLERRYSASPGEVFFTGGGAHVFANFDKKDNGRIMTMREGLRNSVNLVFIRVMRDVIRHFLYREPGSSAQILRIPNAPEREIYLRRFADYEGSVFIRKFYHRYKSHDKNEALELLTQSGRTHPVRLATIFRTVAPEASAAEFESFLRSHTLQSKLGPDTIGELFTKYSPDKFNLADRGYIAGVHPLELWLVAYLHRHPEASLTEVLAASAPHRQEVYSWLFRASKRAAQDVRIRTLLEQEAFMDLHQAWRRLGYPFPTLVPSYATAIGSSADRPAALAELMGILLNEGLRLPTYRVESLLFGADTPYETRFEQKPATGARVMPAEVAHVALEAIRDVVTGGTAQRVAHAFRLPDGREFALGGKTGTGDNRSETFGPGGRILASTVLNRTATFVFFIGDRFFGTMTVFVQGAEAEGYSFTSALPLAVLKTLAPSLMPIIRQGKLQPEALALAQQRQAQRPLLTIPDQQAPEEPEPVMVPGETPPPPPPEQPQHGPSRPGAGSPRTIAGRPSVR